MYPITVEKIKLIVFFSLLLAAAIRDVKSRMLPDKIWMTMMALSFLSWEPVSLLGICVGIPFFLAGITIGGIGGGDIKISAASGMVLGFEKGIAGVCMGLLLLVLFHLGRQMIGKIRKEGRMGQAYPLVPFLFLGMAVMVCL